MTEKRCGTCKYSYYYPGTYWEPPEEGCRREDDLIEYEDILDLSEVGNTIDCPVWEEADWPNAPEDLFADYPQPEGEQE